MPFLPTYRGYFDIDPDYFPVVNENVITKHPDMWKKFYPHKTFVELLKTTVDALDRKKKLSIWVEGAYGTGKSHAVLTLKKLLEAGADEARAYFERHKLDMDLYNKLQRIKDSGKVLTVHRYGSSGIEGDNALVLAVQESVERALSDAGIENAAADSLKDAAIAWLSNEENKQVFNIYAQGSYKDDFGGDDVDAILNKLKTYQDAPLLELMGKVFKVARERQFRAFTMTPRGLCDWLKEVISANGLKAIVFIWDEFTEFFKKNAKSLTGFQEICELSETHPFYFIIVTHVSSALFSEGDQDYKKLNDRFVKPHSQISLPETIAFQLMGAAMEKNEEESIAADWQSIVDDLARRTRESRTAVEKAASIPEKDMLGILPIHPLAALLLKHIATAFESNQRSMFDFIKNESGDDAGGGFQWFIDNYGPGSSNNLLTIDLLWDFFYEKGRDFLAPDIRAILDYFNKSACQTRTTDDKRVIKTVLLMQAISQRTGDAVDLFVATGPNLDLAFEGTDIEGAGRAAERLSRNKDADGNYREGVLSKRELVSGNVQYIASINDINEDELKKIKEDIDKKSTAALVLEDIGGTTVAEEAVRLEGAMKLRYELYCACDSDFDQKTRPLRYNEAGHDGKIKAVVCFAKDEKEAVSISKKIAAALNEGSYHLVFIDTTDAPFGNAFDTYKNELARAMYLSGKDNSESKQHANRARDALKDWARRIASRGFSVYSEQCPSGERASTMEALTNALKAIDKKIFPLCLECEYNVLPTMYVASSLAFGVKCGATRTTSQMYKSGNANTKLETALKDAWDESNYWERRPNLLISKIKIAVDNKIKEGFANDGRASIRNVYEMLKAKPYGFMPCNLTAFIMGFVLKEYTDGSFSWSDGTTSCELTVDKLKEMLSEVISLQSGMRYNEKYIVEMSAADKAFNEITASAFGIPLELCASVEQTRARIRAKMRELSFPIWTVKQVLPEMPLKTERAVLDELIDSYREIANNTSEDKSEKSIARAIGNLSIKNPDAKDDLKMALTAENCTSGMRKYVSDFEGGALTSLAAEVGDAGQYINALRAKFSLSADANWVWNIDTANDKIRETILDYKIIAESNKIIAKTASFDEAIREWCNKCSLIRVSYAAAKGYLGGIAPLIAMLYSIKQAGSIKEGQRGEFLEQLRAHGDEFSSFYSNQFELFKKVCAHYVEGLSDDEARELFGKIPEGTFTYDQSEYLNLVGKKAEEHRSSLKSTQLKTLWQKKTGSASPKQWSKEHLMPILALVPDGEVREARAAFDAVNAAHPDADTTNRAISYLEKASFYDAMKDSQELDRVFTESIIKSNAVMLPDVAEVKEYLMMRIGAEPYDWWFALPEIEKRLKQMAEAKYSSGGYARALEKIDGMPVDEVKRYLKELIRNNMTVGMEIIKEN